jgi:predicted transcriptional regulator
VAVAPLLTVNKRLESLMSSGLITRQGNHYRVSWKGNLVHRIISLYRKVMLINVTG